MELHNAVVVITGGAVGIGRETAIAFSKRGARVVICYHQSRKEALQLSTTLHATAVALDVRSDSSIREALEQIKATFSRIDILVNNAGVMVRKPLREQASEQIDNQIATNLTGLIKTTREFLPYLAHGMIINIASGAGKQGYGGLGVYSATKFGVRGFTQALANEEPNTKVFVVNPGLTKTRMTDFRGIEPSIVAEIIVQTAEEKLGKKSGDDIDVWDYARLR